MLPAFGVRPSRPYGFFELAKRREGFDGFIPGQSRQILEITRR